MFEEKIQGGKPTNVYLLQTEKIHNLITEIDCKLAFIANVSEEQMCQEGPINQQTELQMALDSIIHRLESLKKRTIV